MSPADGSGADRHQETEYKYRVPAGFVLPVVTGDRYPVEGPVSHDLVATYWDTADLRLARDGITLRHRVGEGSADGWHLKLPHNPRGGALVREEIRAPGGPDRPPTPLAEALIGRTRELPLLAVARLVTHRSEYRLADPTGRAVAVVADDVVTGQRAGQPEVTFREVEVEDAGGGRSLKALDRVMRRAGAVPESHPKLTSVLGPEATAETEPPIRRADRGRPAGIALERLLRRMVRQLLDCDIAVRLGEPAAIQQMRVAVRRLQALLEAFEPILDGGAVNRLDGELAWLASALDGGRDDEVVLERLLGDLAALPPELVIGPVPRRLGQAAGDGEAATETAQASLRDARYRHLLDALVTAMRSPPVTAAAGEPAEKVVPVVIRAARARLAGTLAAVAEGRADDGQRDRTLIAVNKLRYTAEAFEPFTAKSLRRLGRAAADLQGCLGVQRDAALAAGRLLAAARQGGAGGFTLGVLYARQEAAAASAAAEAAALATQLQRVKLPEWLAG
jgi:CHAD domain-containing protein